MQVEQRLAACGDWHFGETSDSEELSSLLVSKSTIQLEGSSNVGDPHKPVGAT